MSKSQSSSDFIKSSFWSLFRDGKGIDGQSNLGTHVKIPDFQRNYSWTDKELSDFMQDISDDIHFRGTEESNCGIIIAIDPNNKDSNNNLFIVDGQQRLATLQMISFIISKNMRGIKKESNEKQKKSLKKQIANIRQCLFDTADNPQFIFNHVDKDIWMEFLSDFDSEIDHDKDIPRSRVDDSLKFLDNYIKKNLKGKDTNSQIEYLTQLWDFIKGHDTANSIPGIAFHVFLEPTTLKAIKRFERENNRGLDVALDDLIRSYLIESIHRKCMHIEDPDTRNQSIESDCDKIVKRWADYIEIIHEVADTNQLKKSFVNWFVSHKSGIETVSDYKKHVQNKLIPQRDKSKSEWDAYETADELATWAEAFSDLRSPSITKGANQLTQQQMRLHFFYARGLRQIWGVLIPLRLRIKEQNYSKDIDKITGLPNELLRHFEYITVTNQLAGAGITSNTWNPKYAKWRAELGRKETKVKDVISTIMKDIQEAQGSNNKPLFMKPKEFLDAYTLSFTNLEENYIRLRPHFDKIAKDPKLDFSEEDNLISLLEENLNQDTLDKNNIADIFSQVKKENNFYSDKKTTHTRVLFQANRNLGEAPGLEFKERSLTGNQLEHICPEKYGPWLQDQVDPSNDTSLYSLGEWYEVQHLIQHIGNHTILDGIDNNRLNNHTFYDKKWVPPTFKDPTSTSYIKKINDRPCYKKYNAIPTTYSLMQHTTTFPVNEIVNRGCRILMEWMESLKMDLKDISKHKYQYNFTPDLTHELEDIESLLTAYESSKLEFKAGFWLLDNKGNVKRNDTHMPFAIAKVVNGMLNTDGGTIILGRQDRLKPLNAQNIVGLEDTLNSLSTNEEEAVDELQRAITDYLKTTIPKIHRNKIPKVSFHKLSFDKSIISLTVSQLPKSKKPMPIIFEDSENFYYTRPTSANYLVPLKVNSEAQKQASTEGTFSDTSAPDNWRNIFDVSTNPKNNQSTLGPYPTEEKARGCQKMLETYFKLKTKVSFLSFKSSPGGVFEEFLSSNLGIKIEDIGKSNKKWTKNGRGKGVWAVNVKNLPVEWNDNDFYLDKVQLDLEEKEKFPHICGLETCNVTVKNPDEMQELFGLRWTGSKFLIQSRCREHR